MARSSRKTKDIIRVFDFVQLIGRELENMPILKIRLYIFNNLGVTLGTKSLIDICELLKVKYEV